LKPTASAPRTVGDWWREIEHRFARARLFFGHGTHSARDEAAWLVCYVSRLPFDELATALNLPVKPAVGRRLQMLASRRITEREPLAYLLREAWLGNHRFYVDRRVIVPRSHIAELIPEALNPWLPKRAVRRILDLGTGSGCLAILCALAFPTARVDAADLSRDALAVARRNVRDYQFGDRVRLVESNLFSALSQARYDLIVCNPPYVADAAMRRLPAEYRREPRLALAGGRDGLALVKRLLAEAPRYLSPNGVLVVEVGDGRRAVQRAFPRLQVTWLATGMSEDAVFLARRPELGDL